MRIRFHNTLSPRLLNIGKAQESTNTKLFLWLNYSTLTAHLTVPAGIRIADTNDGVDVRVGLLNDLGQVLDRHLRIVSVDLLDG
jgi:hypothetical protein